MNRFPIRIPRRSAALALAAAFAFLGTAAPARAAGKVQGKVLGGDTGEPISFADVLLIPADTTLRRVGGLTNSDGTFLLAAAPGRYVLQVRAISYARKRIEGVLVEEGKVTPLTTTIEPEALIQEEVVVEARAKQNTENAILAQRRKAATVGEAVSAEQVRRSPDKDAADVLRRVTGLTVSDGKYVFVRGLGERYSSTAIDGVRLASPEQNKRVVPLDLIPAALLDNITVQKTYTADRPGEFGGGDVQVQTKDFPGSRTLAFTFGSGWNDGATFRAVNSYRAGRGDIFGFGGSGRDLPAEVLVAGDRQLVLSNDPRRGFRRSQLADFGGSFNNVWTPNAIRAIPTGSLSGTFGDEFRVLGRALGVIATGTFSRGYDLRREHEGLNVGAAGQWLYAYDSERTIESAQLGAVAGVSYRLAPNHSLHVRNLYSHDMDDEVRIYEGFDRNKEDENGYLLRRGTRLKYVERDLVSNAFEGRHEFARLAKSKLEWKLSRSSARLWEPDRRESVYYLFRDFDGSSYWTQDRAPTREYTDLKDRGIGFDGKWSLPYRLGALGAGRLEVGGSYLRKNRDNYKRRFVYKTGATNLTAMPESLYSAKAFDDTLRGAYVEEVNFRNDNYAAEQVTAAGFASLDLPLGRRLRATLGVRVEDGSQEVRTFDLFRPGEVTALGDLSNTDVLPSLNLTASLTDQLQLRLGASRTLNRPDLNELSPSPSLEFVGGYVKFGNPALVRARMDNVDARLELYPGLGELFAVGVFTKRLEDPVELALYVDGSQLSVAPQNAERGRNSGVELEIRSGLGRFWRRLSRLSLNFNAAVIRSEVTVGAAGRALGTSAHPLQGQADYTVNGAVSWALSRDRGELTMLVSVVGERLRFLGYAPTSDVYERPVTTHDATLNLRLSPRWRLKLAGRNLFDAKQRDFQDGAEISRRDIGRSASVALSFDS